MPTDPPLTLQLLRELRVDRAEHPRGQPHLSAASGLVRAGDICYVIADDENHLGVFRADADEPVRLLRLFRGELPENKKERKAVKPDLEVLFAVPASPGLPSGALLCMGSGSRANRQRGALLALQADGRTVGTPRPIDLAALYAPLGERFSAVNIEGGLAGGGDIRLLQRGNTIGAANACVAYGVAEFCAWLAEPATAPPAPRSITPYDLGDVDGIPFGFTDGAALPGGAWIFSAVAENSSDSYADGPCAASVIGLVDADGRVVRRHRLRGAPKVEGIAARVEGGSLLVTAVTDADDPSQASQLLCGATAWPPLA